MEVNKLIDKTKEVIKKQQEFNDVVDELKLEVKDVFMKNKQLNEENILLKQRISKYEKVEAKEEQSNTVENESIKAQIKKPLDVEEIIIEKVETEEFKKWAKKEEIWKHGYDEIKPRLAIQRDLWAIDSKTNLQWVLRARAGQRRPTRKIALVQKIQCRKLI